MFLKSNVYGQVVISLINVASLFLILQGKKKKKGKRAFYSRETSKHPGSAAVPCVSNARNKERDHPRESIEETGCLSSPSSPPLGIQVTTWSTY